MQTQKRTVESFLDNEVKYFSISVIKDRALPSVIDGLKPSGRKVLFTATKKATSFVHTFAFVGYCAPIGGYDKGDASLSSVGNSIGVVAGLTQDFVGTNNYPWMSGSGAFGTRFKPKTVAASRYTKSKLHPNVNKFFVDSELLEYDLQDDKYFEPKHYLPIVPTILLNPSTGISVGYKCDFLPYNLKDIKKNIKRYLSGKSIKSMTPYYKGYKGRIFSECNTWIMLGNIQYVNEHRLVIDEIPIGISREKYIEHLEKMVDKGEIDNYSDQCGEWGFKFEISLRPYQFQYLTDGSFGDDCEWFPSYYLYEKFNLKKTLYERLNCISEHDRLLQFNTTSDIIRYFCEFRMGIYEKKRAFMIKKNQDEIGLRQSMIRYIELCRTQSINLSNMESKKQLIGCVRNFPELKQYVDKLIDMPTYKITVEEINRLKERIRVCENEIKFYENVTSNELFVTDLDTLK